MFSRRLLGSLFGILLVAASALGAVEPRNTVSVTVDGVTVDGVVGYQIAFSRDPVPRTDSRRLDLAYSPDQRRLVVTVTQKGLSRLQDWINAVTDTGTTPAGRTVQVIAKDESDQVLVRWELSGVVPTTLSSSAAGLVTEVTATLEFAFDRMRIVEALPK